MSSMDEYKTRAQEIFDLVNLDLDSQRAIREFDDPEYGWATFLSLAFALGDEQPIVGKLEPINAAPSGVVRILTRTSMLAASYGGPEADTTTSVRPAALTGVEVSPRWAKSRGEWTVREFSFSPTVEGSRLPLTVTYRLNEQAGLDHAWIEETYEQLNAMIR